MQQPATRAELRCGAAPSNTRFCRGAPTGRLPEALLRRQSLLYFPTIATMGETITPRELATELGVSDRTVRQWLRDKGWQSVPYARWNLTPEQAERVRAHFRR